MVVSVLASAFTARVRGEETVFKPFLAPASDEAELSIKKYKVSEGLKVSLFAAEPMLAHPVAICSDEKGRLFVAETFRFADGINGGGDRDFGGLDMRGHMGWLEQDLSNRTVEEREAMLKRNMGDKVNRLTVASDQIRMIEDRAGTGKADHATVFASGFNRISDGVGAGVLARKGNVWFTCIPDLWMLRDNKGTGIADERKVLHHGFGVRIAFLGHDLHGLCLGPDGKLYFSVGDRGFNVTAETPLNAANEKEQQPAPGADWRGPLMKLAHSDMGAAFRCNQDGSDFELVAVGLRNPQGLAFDQYGNLFTGDNNADHGDAARWVYIVDGGDSGWRGGYQYITWPNELGAWNSEKLWGTPFENQAAYIVPPVADIGVGPSGIKYYPGTGLPERFNEHFFYCDYRGESGGIFSFALKPKGASYEVTDQQEFFWKVQATDLVFGVDGGAYVSVWYGGINKTGKGSIYRIYDPELAKDSLVLETKKLIADTEGMERRTASELTGLLSHRDQRVRMEAQFALADKGTESIATFVQILKAPQRTAGKTELARLHAIWGLGQLGRNAASAYEALLPFLDDPDAEVRSQAAKVLGEGRCAKAFDAFIKLLHDSNARTQFFAAMGLAKLGRKEALDPILEMLRNNSTHDALLRHAGIMALVSMKDTPMLLRLAGDNSPAVRMAALVAMRRLELPDVAVFLRDAEPALVLEAARAINDVPINASMPQLAALIEHPTDSDALSLRVVNANARLGTAQNAAALAAYSANGLSRTTARIAALRALASWAKPSNLDLLVGLWRPLEPRDGKIAADAARGVLPGIIREAALEVRVAAVAAALKLEIKETGPALLELFSDIKLPPAARINALQALGSLGCEHLAAAVGLAISDRNELVRKEGNRQKGLIDPAVATTMFAGILEKNASIPEQQGALSSLGASKDPKADEIILKWLEKLAAGLAPKEIQLELLEAAGRRSSAPIKAALEKYNAAQAQTKEVKDDSLAGYRETLYGGDAAEGKKVFFEKAEASCTRCHKINDTGGDAGPVLSDIGKRQNREYILESIVDPNRKIAPGFESLIVKLNNGKTHVGIVKSETATELLLNAPPDGILKILKSEIKISKRGQSLMPEGLGKLLTKQDLRNLVEYMAGLTGAVEAKAGHGAH